MVSPSWPTLNNLSLTPYHIDTNPTPISTTNWSWSPHVDNECGLTINSSMYVVTSPYATKYVVIGIIWVVHIGPGLPSDCVVGWAMYAGLWAISAQYVKWNNVMFYVSIRMEVSLYEVTFKCSRLPNLENWMLGLGFQAYMCFESGNAL